MPPSPVAVVEGASVEVEVATAVVGAADDVGGL